MVACLRHIKKVMIDKFFSIAFYSMNCNSKIFTFLPLLFVGFNFVVAAAICDQSREISFRLKSWTEDALSMRANRARTSDAEALINLQKIAVFKKLVPEVKRSSRTFNAEEEEALKRHRLYSYYLIEPENFGGRCPEDIISLLMQNSLVEYAVQEPLVVDSDFPSYANPRNFITDDPFLDFTDCSARRKCQFYMHGPTPIGSMMLGGLNVLEAQRITNNLGGASRIWQLEFGNWESRHIDLPLSSFDLDSKAIGSHATKAAGIMWGLDNKFGVKGIAAKARAARATYSLQNLIALYNYVQPGDSIQIGIASIVNGPWCEDWKIKINACRLPVEYTDSVRDAISYLVKVKKVHVILPAGNGDVNLDHPSFNGRFSRREEDTGSIYAGAANPVTGAKASFSNYGSRVNLFSWGEEVTTTDINNSFTHTFQGTSSSSAILSGAVAFLSSVAQANGLGILSPQELRQILVDTGHRIPSETNKNIGNQPDLVRAVDRLKKMAQATLKIPNKKKRILGMAF